MIHYYVPPASCLSAGARCEAASIYIHIRLREYGYVYASYGARVQVYVYMNETRRVYTCACSTSASMAYRTYRASMHASIYMDEYTCA